MTGFVKPNTECYLWTRCPHMYYPKLYWSALGSADNDFSFWLKLDIAVCSATITYWRRKKKCFLVFEERLEQLPHVNYRTHVKICPATSAVLTMCHQTNCIISSDLIESCINVNTLLYLCAHIQFGALCFQMQLCAFTLYMCVCVCRLIDVQRDEYIMVECKSF